MENNEFVEDINKIDQTIIKFNENLSKHTTLKIGGNAKYFITPNTFIQAKKVLKIIKKYKLKYFYLGNGSNVLFDSAGYDGVIINLKFKSSPYDNILMASDLFATTAYKMYQKGISNLALLHMIPASVGGAIFMNAGISGNNIGDFIEYVYYLDDNLEFKVIKKEDCQFSYRNSIFKNNKTYLILGCKIALIYSDKEKIKIIMDETREKRLKTQPYDYPNAGSIFKNPPKNSSWKLIKESSVNPSFRNGIRISEKHNNFLIKTGEASSQDVLFMIENIQKTVYNKTGIILEKEIIVVDRR